MREPCLQVGSSTADGYQSVLQYYERLPDGSLVARPDAELQLGDLADMTPRRRGTLTRVPSFLRATPGPLPQLGLHTSWGG